MDRRKRLVAAKLAVLMTGACLLASGACVSKTVGTNIADQTATRVATLLIDAVLYNPLKNALESSAAQAE